MRDKLVISECPAEVEDRAVPASARAAPVTLGSSAAQATSQLAAQSFLILPVLDAQPALRDYTYRIDTP